MSYIIHDNEYKGTDGIVRSVFLMHAVSCCSNLQDPRNKNAQRFDYRTVRLHPASFNQGWDDNVLLHDRWQMSAAVYDLALL